MDAEKIVDVALELGAAITKVALEALRNGDPEAMKKVTDVLPPGHELRSKATLAVEESKTRRAFSG